MELTINIKEQKKITFFLNLLKEFDYVEIVDIREDESILPTEHRALLDERLKKIEDGDSDFKSWDLIKKKYAGKAI